MRRARWLALFLLTTFIASSADARPRKRRRRPAKKAAVASKKTQVAVNALLKPFKWGMTSRQVLKLVEKDVRARYAPILKEASRDAIKYDKLRREMMSEIRKVRKNKLQFDGKRNPWEVSLIDKEFAQKNNESMIVQWGETDRRFYFFHHDKLWKVYIAFNADRFQGKTFKDFSVVMEERFGRAEQKFVASKITGDVSMAFLEWPPTGKTLMRAIDNTAFYGNFCLVLMDRSELPRVRDGRKLNSPKKKFGDPLVEAVTKDTGDVSSPHDDIVDQITGRGVRAPAYSDTEGSAPPRRSGSSSSSSGSRAKKRKKKVDTDNPLDGLDL